MENPQAQMQGQGQPQAQGQDQQMQQVMQVVQQMVQQGMQPVEIAAQLLQQVPPEAIMQVFVQMGIPQEEAQASIQEAMQQGQQAQQPQGPGEEQMEGAASNPIEGAAESEETQMMYGGGLPRRLVKRNEGGGNPEQEMQAVMGQVQQMMQSGSDARQVMEQIQAAAQQGQISPEVAQAVLEQLSGQMQATDPQDPNAGSNPQEVNPNMASPDSQMMMFGGNLKKLMSKAMGGNLTPPSIDSKTYAQDRASMITNAIKNNTFKSTLDSDFPSLMGNQMMYGGDLPKAEGGFDVTKYKTKDEAELAAYRHRQTLSPEEQAKFNIDETVKGWKEPEPTYEAGKSYEFDPTTKKFKVKEAPAPTYEAGKNYQYDPATKGFKAVDTPATGGVQTVQGVGYPNPFGMGLANNLYHGASPMARFMANSYGYRMPQVRGTNLPGGMDATAFMMQTAGQNLAPGMAGKANGQDYRVTGVEDIKGGLFGRKKVGVRYNIDWGNPASVAAAQQGTPAGPGFSGFNADANGDGIPDYLAGPTVAGPQNQSAGSPTSNNSAGQNYLNSTYGDIRTDLSPDGQKALDELIASGADQNQIDEGVTAILDSRNAALLENEKAAAREAIRNGENPQNIPSFTEPSTEQFDPYTDAEMQAVNQNSMRRNPMMMGTYNNPTANVNSQTQPEEELFPSLAAGSNNMVNQDAIDFQKGQQAKGLEWNPSQQKWLPNKQIQDAISTLNPVGTSNVDASALINPSFTGTVDYSQSNPVSSPADVAPVPSNRQIRQDKRAVKREFRQAGRDIKNMLNDAAAEETQMPAAMQQALMQQELNQQAYGGPVSPYELSNAIQLINKAFGGMIPMAKNGMEMQSSIDITSKKKFNPDWDAVSDMYMGAGNRLVNIMEGANAINPERNMARMSALNTQPMEFSQMKQGLYDQAGNFIPNDIGNQVLNPTDIYASQERQIFAYGGRVYEIGGDVELDDNELAALQQAGFKVQKY
jgi:hypothetical protein